MKLTFLESSYQQLSKIRVFIDFGQVFQKLWQYKWNLATCWHRFLQNMVISGGPGYKRASEANPAGKIISFIFTVLNHFHFIFLGLPM